MIEYATGASEALAAGIGIAFTSKPKQEKKANFFNIAASQGWNVNRKLRDAQRSID